MSAATAKCPRWSPAARPAAPPTRAIWSGARSSWYGHVLKNALDHFARAQAFDLEFGAQDQPMLEDRRGHRLHVVRSGEIAPVNRRMRAAGEQQGLRGAWATAHQHSFVRARPPHYVDDVA